MATEVLLMDDVADLGEQGDVVTVSDGYARNYLLPRKLAAPVTEATRRRLVKLQKEREVQRKLELDRAQAQAARQAGVSCTITVKASEGDHLYGSVTAADIAKALGDQGIPTDRHAVLLDQPIKELGCYDIKLKLHPKVEGTVKVWVVEE